MATSTNGVDYTLTPGRAAYLLGVGTNTVARWVDEGRLSCIRIPPRNHRRYSHAEVERLRGEVS